MCTLTEQNMLHRLMIVSCDGNENMEVIVDALHNICVDNDGKESNAIGGSHRHECVVEK